MHVARSALGVRCVLASLLERNSLAGRAARDVARFRFRVRNESLITPSSGLA